MLSHRSRVALAAFASAALLLTSFAAATVEASNRALLAQLSARSVVAGQVAANGAGVAVIKRTSLDGPRDEVCWLIVTRGIRLDAQAGGIFQIGAGGSLVAEPVDLAQASSVTYPHRLPTTVVAYGLGGGIGLGRGCVSVSDSTLDAIWSHPSAYSLGVEEAPAPGAAPSTGGWIRGPLY